MLEQAKRPDSSPKRSAAFGDSESLVRRPIDREVDPFGLQLAVPENKRQTKKAGCSKCGGSVTPCPACGGNEDLETPPQVAKRSVEGDLGNPAERQADAIGAQIGAALPNHAVTGGSLSEAARSTAESHLGIDLDGTRIDGGSAGHAKARSEDAWAVTEGSEIAFADGQLQQNAQGRFLLGHELVHVAQQRAAKRAVPQRKGAKPEAAKKPDEKVKELPPEEQRGLIEEIQDILDGKLQTATSGLEQAQLRSAWTTFGEGKAFELAASRNLSLWIRTRTAYPSLGDDLEKAALEAFKASITSQALSRAKANEEAARNEMLRFGIREDEKVVSEVPPSIANPVAAMTFTEEQKAALKETTDLVRIAVHLERVKRGMLGTPVGTFPLGRPSKPSPPRYTGSDVPLPQDTSQPLFEYFTPGMVPPNLPLLTKDGETTIYAELKLVWATAMAVLGSIKATSPAVFALTEKRSGKTVMPVDPEKEPATAMKALQSQLHVSVVNAAKLQKEIHDGNFEPGMAHDIQDRLIETEPWSAGFRGYVAAEFVKQNREKENLPLGIQAAYAAEQLLSPDPGFQDVAVAGWKLHRSKQELNQLQMMRGAQIQADLGFVYGDQITAKEAEVETNALDLRVSALALGVGLVTAGMGDALVKGAKGAKIANAASDAAKLRVVEGRTAALERRFAKEFKGSDELREASTAIREAKNAEEAGLEFEKLQRRLRVTETGGKESTTLTTLEKQNELRFLEDNPELIHEGPDGLRARIGKHEWRQRSDGMWCRFSEEDCIWPPQGKVHREKTATSYRASDPSNERFGAAGYLDDGELNISMRTKLDDETRGALRGEDEFKAMLEHFGDNVKVIRGHWTFGDNLASFNKGVRAGMSLEDAALSTWTGKQAFAAGFGKAKIGFAQMSNGVYVDVEVRFLR